MLNQLDDWIVRVATSWIGVRSFQELQDFYFLLRLSESETNYGEFSTSAFSTAVSISLNIYFFQFNQHFANRDIVYLGSTEPLKR